MIQEKSSKKRIISAFRAGAFPVFLMLALLGSQAVSLQHDHDGDLSHHLDCSICVKKTNDTDFLVSTAPAISEAGNAVEYIVSSQSVTQNTPLNLNSRSPPSHS